MKVEKTTVAGPCWVYRVEVLDKPGAMTSIASAFSNEGINLDTISAHGAPCDAKDTGTVVLSFFASEADQEKMSRKVERLAKVVRFEMYSYASTFLRKSALLVTNRALDPKELPEGVLFERLAGPTARPTYFLAGVPSVLDEVVARLDASGAIEDIVYTVLGL